MNIDQLIEFVESSDMRFNEDNGIRFVVETGSYSEHKALDTLELVRSKVVRSKLIEDYCFDDGMIHITVTHDVLEDINYKY